MDAHSSNLTRPAQMMLSQFLIGFGSTFFLAPVLIAGVGSLIAQPRNLISFFVMFSIAQNLGSLFGSAFLGTFQVVRQKYHSSQLVENLTLLDPQVAGRIQASADHLRAGRHRPCAAPGHWGYARLARRRRVKPMCSPTTMCISPSPSSPC